MFGDRVFKRILKVKCGVSGKNPPANAGDVRDMGSIPGLGRSLGGKAWQSTPVFLPGEFHEQRNLATYS